MPTCALQHTYEVDDIGVADAGEDGNLPLEKLLEGRLARAHERPLLLVLLAAAAAGVRAAAAAAAAAARLRVLLSRRVQIVQVQHTQPLDCHLRTCVRVHGAAQRRHNTAQHINPHRGCSSAVLNTPPRSPWCRGSSPA
jgi:hypothetical protein